MNNIQKALAKKKEAAHLKTELGRLGISNLGSKLQSEILVKRANESKELEKALLAAKAEGVHIIPMAYDESCPVGKVEEGAIFLNYQAKAGDLVAF